MMIVDKKKLRKKDLSGKEYWIFIGWEETPETQPYDKYVTLVTRDRPSSQVYSGMFISDEIGRNLMQNPDIPWSIASSYTVSGRTNSVHMVRKIDSHGKRKDAKFRTLFIEGMDSTGEFRTWEFDLSYKQSRQLINALSYGIK